MRRHVATMRHNACRERQWEKARGERERCRLGRERDGASGVLSSFKLLRQVLIKGCKANKTTDRRLFFRATENLGACFCAHVLVFVWPGCF